MEPNNITEEDLIALHLRELDPARERAVRRAMAADAALAAEYGAIAATFAGLRGESVKVDAAVVDRNWKALRPSLKTHVLPAPAPAWRMPVLAGLALAGAATLAYVMLHGPASAPAANEIATPAPPQGAPALTQSPKQADEVPVPLRTDSGFQGHLSGGVYHPSTKRSDKPVRMLPLATRPWPDAANPPSKQAATRPVAIPLTEQPTSPTRATPEPLIATNEQPDQAMKADHAAHGGASQSAGHGGTSAAGLKGGVRAKPRGYADVMLGLGGTFIVPRTTLVGGTVQDEATATHAISSIAAVHQQFRTALGYRVTASYTRPDFSYYASGQSGHMNSRIFELTAAYVVQGPHHKRLTTTGEIGVAGLLFVPQVQSSSGQKLYRVGGVVGVNLDYAITKHIGARLGYRAQVYRLPDFQDLGSNVAVTTPLTVSNEPMLGITYKFGK